MATFDTVEQQFGFKLPDVFRTFVERGYLDAAGPTYLWLEEAEWLAPDDILQNRGFYGSPKPGLVAFAHTGSRDLWTWQTQEPTDTRSNNYRIMLCPRDCFEGEWYAPDLLGWLYRISLGYAASPVDNEAETRTRLRRYAALLNEFSRPSMAAEIQSIAGLPLRRIVFGSRGQFSHEAFLSNDEVLQRVRSAIGNEYVDTPYVWDTEG